MQKIRTFYALLSIKNTIRLGVEPRTFRLTAECSNQLSYPIMRLRLLAFFLIFLFSLFSLFSLSSFLYFRLF